MSYLLVIWRHIHGVCVPSDWPVAGSSLLSDLSCASLSDVPPWTQWSVQRRIPGTGSVSVVIHGMTPPNLCISNLPPPPTCPIVVLWVGTPLSNNFWYLRRTSRRSRWEGWARSEFTLSPIPRPCHCRCRKLPRISPHLVSSPPVPPSGIWQSSPATSAPHYLPPH